MRRMTESEYRKQKHDALIKRAEDEGLVYINGNLAAPEKIKPVAKKIFAEMLCILNQEDPEIGENKKEWMCLLDSCKTLGDLEEAGFTEYEIYKYMQILDELYYYTFDESEYEDRLLEGAIGIRCSKCEKFGKDCPMEKDEDCPYLESVEITYNN